MCPSLVPSFSFLVVVQPIRCHFHHRPLELHHRRSSLPRRLQPASLCCHDMIARLTGPRSTLFIRHPPRWAVLAACVPPTLRLPLVTLRSHPHRLIVPAAMLRVHPPASRACLKLGMLPESAARSEGACRRVSTLTRRALAVRWHCSSVALPAPSYAKLIFPLTRASTSLALALQPRGVTLMPACPAPCLRLPPARAGGLGASGTPL